MANYIVSRSNQRRAKNAAAALVCLAKKAYGKQWRSEPRPQWLVDLLADLMHWAVQHKVSWDDAVRMATDHFRTEAAPFAMSKSNPRWIGYVGSTRSEESAEEGLALLRKLKIPVKIYKTRTSYGYDYELMTPDAKTAKVAWKILNKAGRIGQPPRSRR